MVIYFHEKTQIVATGDPKARDKALVEKLNTEQITEHIRELHLEYGVKLTEFGWEVSFRV